MRVKVTDEKTGVSFVDWLENVIPDPDDCFFVRQALCSNGVAYVGGGAAPSFCIEQVKEVGIGTALYAALYERP